jgi:hydrogenase nickel incorporation protein HypA/HybF
MHEFSVAKSIVDTILHVAETNKATRVIEANLEIGEISLVNLDQLNFHIEMLTENTIAQGIKINGKEKPVKIRCAQCGYEGPVKYIEKNPEWHLKVPIFQCVKCESPDTVILEGRELKIIDINVSFDRR